MLPTIAKQACTAWAVLTLIAVTSGCGSDPPAPDVCGQTCSVTTKGIVDNFTSNHETLGMAVEIIAWGRDGQTPPVVSKNQRTVAAGAPFYVDPNFGGTGRVWLQRANASSGNLNTTAPAWILNAPTVDVREMGASL